MGMGLGSIFSKINFPKIELKLCKSYILSMAMVIGVGNKWVYEKFSQFSSLGCLLVRLMSENHAIRIYQIAKESLAGRKITMANVLQILTQLMELVEDIPGMEGKDKKELVLNVLDMLLGDMPIGKDEKDLIMAVAKSPLMGYLVDELVLAARGELQVNEGRLRKLRRKLCGCC